jgi:hypothetical protein
MEESLESNNQEINQSPQMSDEHDDPDLPEVIEYQEEPMQINA